LSSLSAVSAKMSCSSIVDAVVVGSGLSGCVCARSLVQDFGLNVVVLESLDRIGGRTFSHDGLDLGAAWSWPSHDKNLGKLMQELQIKEFVAQDVQGKSVVQLGDGAVREFSPNASPSGPGSIRLAHGSGSICKTIVEKHSLNVETGAMVESIQVSQDASKPVVVKTAAGNSFQARAVVVAMPPKQAASITYEPALPEEQRKAQISTQTWMGNAAKVCLTFSLGAAFWRTQLGMNGTFMSHKGPINQGWDNSNKQHEALCGFVFEDDLKHVKDLQAQLDNGVKEVNSPILDQFQEIFGPQVRGYSSIHCQAWDYTDETKGVDPATVQSGVNYGGKLLSEPLLGRVFFSGTETQADEHGHMEGAVMAGQRAAKQVGALLGSESST